MEKAKSFSNLRDLLSGRQGFGLESGSVHSTMACPLPAQYHTTSHVPLLVSELPVAPEGLNSQPTTQEYQVRTSSHTHLHWVNKERV